MHKGFIYRAATLCGKLSSFFAVVVRARVAAGQLSFVGAFQGLKMEVGKLCKCMFICSHSPWAGRSLCRRRLSSSGGCRGPRRNTGEWEELLVRRARVSATGRLQYQWYFLSQLSHWYREVGMSLAVPTKQSKAAASTAPGSVGVLI